MSASATIPHPAQLPAVERYVLTYEFWDLATVEIQPETAATPIKEMVEFWGNWEDHLEDEDGDYTRCFLKNLADFILQERRAPIGILDGKGEDEGWLRLDASNGITVKDVSPYYFSRSEIEVSRKA